MVYLECKCNCNFISQNYFSRTTQICWSYKCQAFLPAQQKVQEEAQKVRLPVDLSGSIMFYLIIEFDILNL